MIRAPRILSLLITATLVVGGSAATASAASTVTPAPPSPPAVSTPVAMLSTMGGVPLWSRSGQSQRAVASTIKLLNVLVARERASLDETVVVPAKAAAIDDGDVGLVTGQKLTVRQLIDMMLIASANDAAETLAIHIGRSEARYVALMNAKAHQLGLQKTYAADPHGLGKRERSCAQDLTILARRVLADPVLRTVVRKQSVVVPHPGKKASVLRSTYHLLGSYPGIEGVKTGYTRASGFCFVGAAKRGNIELVGVVLGAKSNSDRFAQMRRLLDWGFAHTHMRTLVTAGTSIAVTVPGPSITDPASPRIVLAHPSRTMSMPMLDRCGAIALRVRASSVTAAPVVTGRQVALLDLCLGTRVLATVPLIAYATSSATALTFPMTALRTPQVPL